MTYNTTADALKDLKGKSLFLLCPDVGTEGWWTEEDYPRDIYLSEEVRDAVNMDNEDGVDEVMAELRALMDEIVVGQFVTVAQKPFQKDRDAVFARIYPVHQDVWDIRSLTPSPGARVFGRFASKNVFVALTVSKRDVADFDEERERVIEHWQKLFGCLQPHKGTKHDDFFDINSADA